MKNSVPIIHYTKSLDGTMFWKSSDILLLLNKAFRDGNDLKAIINALEDVYHADSN